MQNNFRVKSNIVNDIHSQLNKTSVFEIYKPNNVQEIQEIIKFANANSLSISIASGFHAMGGQQFIENGILIDSSNLKDILSFNHLEKTIEVESGVNWLELIEYLQSNHENRTPQLSIKQKQTGADSLAIGGALSSNIHGRGLQMKPFIDDIDSFIIISASGDILNCSRTENSELFRLAIGGYGMFGVIYSVTIRLCERTKVKRFVEIEDVENLENLLSNRIADGFKYGDFQFSTNSDSDNFLSKGVFSCYLPVTTKESIPDEQTELTIKDWKYLLYLAHFDKQNAFDYYSSHYLKTDKQVYWSDTHQLSIYLNNYHKELDDLVKSKHKCTEMITEIYVPIDNLNQLLEFTRADFRNNDVNLIYGTIRFIKKDFESFLAWAKEDYACIVFNLHIEHTDFGLNKAKQDFRRLIKRAIEFNGNFYLTYHPWATKSQLLTCYPQISEFIRVKKVYDSNEIFQSNWYCHIKQLLK